MYNWSVYKITCKVNGKSYIGITQKALKSRLKEHFRDAFPGRYNARGTLYALHAAIQKYGKTKFTIEPLMEGLNLQSAQKNEVEFIKKYNSYGGFKNKKGLPRGYNQSLGGEIPDFGNYEKAATKKQPAAQKKQPTHLLGERGGNRAPLNKKIIYPIVWMLIALVVCMTTML